MVGHEYFHNWTGNRVTCRDWFQLSLKEGLTVFRDQEFSADMAAGPTGRASDAARATKRIDDVRVLRQMQFAEDAGPMAHPVRPESYVEINNFYTMTVYEKGSEVVRMYQTLFGRDGFRRGMDLYFERHDGQAVTCDDFRHAMADANGRDLAQFERWYSQAGTPRVTVRTRYDAAAKRYSLTLTQGYGEASEAARATQKGPLLIPFAIGLIGKSGADLPLRLDGEKESHGTTRVLEFTDTSRPSPSPMSRKNRCPRCCAISRRRWWSTTTTRTSSSPSCWRTTAIRSTAGKPASASPRANCWRWRSAHRRVSNFRSTTRWSPPSPRFSTTPPLRRPSGNWR